MSFTIACTEKWRDKSGEQHEKTEFVDCTARGKLAEIIHQYLAKGKQIFVQGRHERQEWEDKNGGGKRYKVHYVIDTMKMLGTRADGGGRMASPGESPASYDDQDFGGPGPGDDDDIPF